jgi:hypothetical protein
MKEKLSAVLTLFLTVCMIVASAPVLVISKECVLGPPNGERGIVLVIWAGLVLILVQLPLGALVLFMYSRFAKVWRGLVRCAVGTFALAAPAIVLLAVVVGLSCNKTGP